MRVYKTGGGGSSEVLHLQEGRGGGGSFSHPLPEGSGGGGGRGRVGDGVVLTRVLEVLTILEGAHKSLMKRFPPLSRYWEILLLPI